MFQVLRNHLSVMLFLLLGSGSAAAGDWKVNLSSQFREEIPAQSGLNCHIYTATALLEARCFRKTGKKLDLSESYLLYSHYISRLKAGDQLTYSDLFAEGDHAATAGRFDAGSHWDDLTRVLGEGVCEESQFPSIAEFEKHLGAFRAAMQVLYALPGAIPSPFMTEVFKNEIQKLSSSRVQEKNTKVTPLDDCFLERPTPHTQKFDETKMKELLDRGIPVVCSAGARLNDPPVATVDILAGTQGHATLVIGYRESPITLFTHGIRTAWLLRDPNYDEPVSGMGRCRTMTWIE